MAFRVVSSADKLPECASPKRNLLSTTRSPDLHFGSSRASPTPAKMESQGVQIVGPGGVPYELGQPMMMFMGQVLLARVDPVRLSNGGTEVHLGRFAPTEVVQDEPRNVGALLFYEACAHIARFHPQVQLISFASSRSIRRLGDPAHQAAARVAAVERIGAMNIQITPKQSGLIVVSGTWAYNERNLRKLATALEEQRAIFRELSIGRSTERRRWFQRLGCHLMRFCCSSDAGPRELGSSAAIQKANE